MDEPGPEYLTVRELAELLRLKERKVYDLAATGQVPCSRATGKLLFPAAEVRVWIDANRTGPSPDAARPPVFLGSHDPLLDWALRESRSGLATHFDSSLDGLARFKRGEGIAVGLHICEPDGWNLETVQEAVGDLDVALLRWATRMRGLVVRPDHAQRVGGLADLQGLKVAPRQAGAGSELLFRRLLKEAGMQPADLDFAPVSRSEQDTVLMVAQAEADVAFGLAALARPYGLSFVPLVSEDFDLLIDRRAWFDPPLQALRALADTPRFGGRAEMLGGYDTSPLGKVKWNA